VEKARKEELVRTLMGRVRLLPHINNKEDTKEDIALRNKSERQAVNAVIQGTASDLVKLAMVALDKRIAQEHQNEAPKGRVELVFEEEEEEEEAGSRKSPDSSYMSLLRKARNMREQGQKSQQKTFGAKEEHEESEERPRQDRVGHVARLVLHVHDELVYEVREDKVDWMICSLVECMERVPFEKFDAFSVDIPVHVFSGKKFGSLSPVCLDDKRENMLGPAEQCKDALDEGGGKEGPEQEEKREHRDGAAPNNEEALDPRKEEEGQEEQERVEPEHGEAPEEGAPLPDSNDDIVGVPDSMPVNMAGSLMEKESKERIQGAEFLSGDQMQVEGEMMATPEEDGTVLLEEEEEMAEAKKDAGKENMGE